MNLLRILAVGGIAALGAIPATTGASAFPTLSLQRSADGLGAVSEVRHRGRPHRMARYHRRQRIVVYPATSAYLCTITPAGRDRIEVPTGKYEAIKLDLQLSKIGRQRELLPHKKFRRATVWLSDDANRLVLRIEAKIFAGTVFAELQSVQFDDGKP